MGRTSAQIGVRSLSLRAVVAFLLLLVFGVGAVPFAQSQVKAPDCCMAAEGKGCSMHLHRAAAADHGGHGIAAVQPRCPCTPMVPASAAAPDALSQPASELRFAPALQRAGPVQPDNLQTAQTLQSSDPRGPPLVMLSA